MAVLECHSEALRHAQDKLRRRICFIPELKSRCFAGAQHDIMRSVCPRVFIFCGRARVHEALRGVVLWFLTTMKRDLRGSVYFFATAAR
jgi:hypothetical protein